MWDDTMIRSNDETAAPSESAVNHARPFMVGACLPTGKLLLPKRYHDPGAAMRMAGMLGEGFGVGVARAKEGDSVLRISSRLKGDSVVTLKVEGALVADWVPLLERECLGHLESRKLVELDFAGVSFVDRSGAAMVRGLVGRGAQVTSASALVNALLGRIDAHEVVTDKTG
jgi:hypothetical protein